MKKLILIELITSLLLVSCLHVQVDSFPNRIDDLDALDRVILRSNVQESWMAWTKAWSGKKIEKEELIERAVKIQNLMEEQVAGTDLGEIVISNRRLIDRIAGLPSDQQAQASKDDALTFIRSKQIKRMLDKGLEQVALISWESWGKPLLEADLLKKLGAARQWVDGLKKDFDAQAALYATVTVMVDKGIKIQQGVGLPDRVLGSAFFIERNGYLLTNYHVIASEVDPSYEGYSRLYVKLSGSMNERVLASVISWDQHFDIALLKIEVDAPWVIPLDTSPAIRPGTRVLAIGSPGGLDSTITSGIVSNMSRRFIPLGEIVQIDAAINPGNSGGPLLSETGAFVGLVFAGIESYEGVNFAVPATYVRLLLPRLSESGKVNQPWLGLHLTEFRSQLIVNYVVPDSPAWHVGIRSGYRLKSLGGLNLSSIVQAQNALLKFKPGMLIESVYSIDETGKLLESSSTSEKTFLTLLGSREQTPFAKAANAGFSLSLLPGVFGFSAEYLGQDTSGIKLIVKEVIPGSTADESGFSQGDTVRVLNWKYFSEEKVLLIQLSVRRRAFAFTENSLQLASYSDTPNFL